MGSWATPDKSTHRTQFGEEGLTHHTQFDWGGLNLSYLKLFGGRLSGRSKETNRKAQDFRGAQKPVPSKLATPGRLVPRLRVLRVVLVDLVPQLAQANRRLGVQSLLLASSGWAGRKEKTRPSDGSTVFPKTCQAPANLGSELDSGMGFKLALAKGVGPRHFSDSCVEGEN